MHQVLFVWVLTKKNLYLPFHRRLWEKVILGSSASHGVAMTPFGHFVKLALTSGIVVVAVDI